MSLSHINQYRVAAVVVTYGSRGDLLSQTAHAILKDVHVVRLLIVDNASSETQAFAKLKELYADRIQIIHHDKNLGSAGGFARGIQEARKGNVDFIYLSDDDVIVSDNFVEAFRKAHRIIDTDVSVLCARRASYWAGTDVHYAPDTTVRPRRYFNVISTHVMKVFLRSLFGGRHLHVAHTPASFFPIIPSSGWAYAGVIIPVEAARNAPLPDTSLGLYLDDIVYSWGVIDAGYPTYALMEPHLIDSEMTHAGAHTATGLFAPSVSSTKIYYETRNRVRVSLSHGRITSLWLFKLQVAIWYCGVCLLGCVQHGVGDVSRKRIFLIREALRAGFDKSRPIPEEIVVKI